MVNARRKGHGYERKVAREFVDMGFDKCLTSRNSNLQMDRAGVDLTGTGCRQIQCKNYRNFAASKMIDVLKGMPEGNNVILLNVTNKGELAIMNKDLFYKIVSSGLRNSTTQNQTKVQ